MFTLITFRKFIRLCYITASLRLLSPSPEKTSRSLMAIGPFCRAGRGPACARALFNLLREGLRTSPAVSPPRALCTCPVHELFPGPEQDCRLAELLVLIPCPWGHHLTWGSPLPAVEGELLLVTTCPALVEGPQEVGRGACGTRMLCSYQKFKCFMNGRVSVCFVSLTNVLSTAMAGFDRVAQLCCCLWGRERVALPTSLWWSCAIFVTLFTCPERGVLPRRQLVCVDPSGRDGSR